MPDVVRWSWGRRREWREHVDRMGKDRLTPYQINIVTIVFFSSFTCPFYSNLVKNWYNVSTVVTKTIYCFF